MEKILKLYTYVDGVHDTPFPNEEHQVVTSSFRSDYKRMGAAPMISCTIMHHSCLDKLWDYNVYAEFNGEKFFIKQIPTSSYDNSDSRYKHELELVSERSLLDNVYFYDVVDSDSVDDKPVSNSSKFAFFGNIHEFATRLNESLKYSKVGYSVVVDDGISSEGKMISFQDQFFSNVLQEIYNTYNIPYYFVGKVIHIGYTNNAIAHTFKYGVDESLLSIQRQNANYKIVNRVTGIGSSDNIPYYYPNDYESKEEVEANGGTWINPQPNLMPSIYRDTFGSERFYNALNNTYLIPNSNEYYEFDNPYVVGKPKEHIVNFEDIKPTIKGITNSNGLRIDMFQEFAYDLNDNDETDEEGNYLHPYFFAKLRRFDGEHGFNLFDHAIDEQEMTISMTSGSCGACEFVIGVDEGTQKNPVQVDASGNLKRDNNGNVVVSGTPQNVQNDTRNNEVWIALKKDINTFGVIMPNATNNYKPSIDDTFVILHIDLPKAYILAAEDKLKEQLVEYMSLNNSEKFNFSISFSRIFFAEHPEILSQLNENARIQIEYDNTRYELYISSYSYSMSSDKPLPEIKVELSDTLTISQNALQTAISEVKSEILSGGVGNSADILKQGLKYFLRKDTNDRTRGKLSSEVGFEVGQYVSGASGAIIYKDSSTGQTIGELDKLYVRMKAYFETLVISEVDTIRGKQIISPAGSVKCIGVDTLENDYRCYFLGEQDGSETSNLFHVNDQAYSQTFNAKEGVSNKISNTYYWRLITNVSSDLVVYKNQKCHYIDLSKTDCDTGSDIPKEGDIINHRGNRTDIDRMNFIESSSVDAFSPNITLFHGVNSYSLNGKDYVSYGVDKTTNKAYMNVYGDMFVGDRNGSTYMRYTPEEGLVIKGKLDIETKLGDSTLKDLISASTPEGYQEFVEKVTQDIEGLQQQIDGAIESYFYQYEPTLSNYPASSWDTKELKDAHLNDTFTNLVDGRSWRWTIENGNYKWTEITDTATTQALALAGQAQDTADGKRRVFVDTPYPPYDKGDLWSRGSEYPLKICVNAKQSGTYEVSDFDYADNNEKLNEQLTTFDYLKAALQEDTTITGGLIQSSLIKLGYTSNGVFQVMSGTNGLYDQSLIGGGIASFWGGGMYDLQNYYTWDGNKWNPKSNVTIPTNIPSGLIRFDGTGYFAKGKFWWDENGEIHADPTALLLSFDVTTGDETLASTIINIRKDLASFMDMWEVKKLSDGTEYLYSKRHLATSGGITMYADDTTSGGSSVYSTLGSLLNVDDSIDASASVDRVLFQAAGSSQWVTKPLSEIGGGTVSGDYLPLSGGTLTGTLLSQAIAPKADNTYSFGYSNYRWAAGHFTKLYVNGNAVWHSGNDGNGSGLDADLLDGKQPSALSVLSASKLTTARTIWGQSFDGSGNVNGDLFLTNNNYIYSYNKEGSYKDILGLSESNNLHVGNGSSEAGYTTSIHGNVVHLRYGTAHGYGLTLSSSGDIGIGTVNPSYKLHVVGSGYFSSDITIANSKYIKFLTAEGNGTVGMYITSNNNLIIGYGIAGINKNTYIDGENIIFRQGASHTEICRFNANGMVWADGVTANIRSTSSAIQFWYKGLETNGVYLGNATLSPFTASTDLISLGNYSRRWKGVYLGVSTGAYNNENGVTFCDSSGNGVSRISQATNMGIISSGAIYLRPGSTKGASGTITASSIGATIDKSGNMLVTGGITMYSDQRKKTILNRVELSLKQIADAPLIEYYYNIDQEKTTHVGSIAQYWAGLNDWFCKLDNEGYYTMEIQNAALASAISIARHLEKYETKTDKKIRQLKKRISQLEDELELLKKGA